MNAASNPRILVVSEIFPPAIGGSGTLMHGIYSRVTNARVAVLTDTAGTDSGSETSPAGITVVRRPMATRNWSMLNAAGLRERVRLARAIRKLIKRREGIVHCARALPEGIAALIAKHTGGPRYVCWAHGEDLATALASREFTLITSAVFAGAEIALANSANTASMLGRFGVPPHKRRVIHPAVDAERFTPAVDRRAVRAQYGDDDHVLLLSVGRLQRRKGYDVAIKAVAALAAELPGIRYVIAGTGDEQPTLERLIADLGVRNRVFLAGAVADSDLPSYYAASDIFLLPNRIDDDGDIEGFGIVFLEAAASGRPVIAGNSGGAPEAVEHGTTGLLVDGARVEAVADAIRSLARSPALRRSMGDGGRTRVLQRFTWSRAAREMEAVHAELTGAAPAGEIAIGAGSPQPR